MTLLAHAIALAPAAGIERVGIRARPLIWSERAGLGVWSTEWDASMKLASGDAFAHHHLLERIAEAQPCLPMRFGTTFASGAAAEVALERRASALRAALARVAGKQELAVTLLWKARAEPAVFSSSGEGRPGRRFLEEKRARFVAADARRSRAAALAESLIAELAADQALVWHEICTSEDVAVSLAVLVPSERAAEMRSDLERRAAALGDDVTAMVSGPWPAYSFAKVE